MVCPSNHIFSATDPERKKQPAPETEVLVEEETSEEEDTPWRIILYDDDVHTFDEVIGQLMKALGCSRSHAESLTYTVHNKGKAQVFEGSFEECFKVNGVLKEIELITEIKG